MVLCPEWKTFIDEEMKKDYMVNLKLFIAQRRKEVNVFPSATDTFNCFAQCKYWNTKVVIVGSEPYNGMGESNGLAFSSLSTRRPIALENIFKEIKDDIWNNNTGGLNIFSHNNLTQWAWQGVLLLNRILTVEEGKSNSHKNKGWEEFTEAAIKMINLHPRKLVFMLWGKDANELKPLINEKKHLILESDHPASVAYNSAKWFGNKHFSKSNNFIKKHYFNQQMPLSWSLHITSNHIIK